MEDKYEEFYYDSLPITIYGDSKDMYGVYPELFNANVYWEYKVEKWKVKDDIWDNFLSNDETLEIEDEEIDKYLDDNYDDLVSKYYEELLDLYEEDAIKDAETNYTEERYYDNYFSDDDYDR